MANSWGLFIGVHLTCGVVCTDWTTWVGTPGAGGLESDKLSLEGMESSVDETEKVKEKGFIWRSGKFNWKPIHHHFKRSTHDRLAPNRNNSHHRTSRNQVSFLLYWEKMDSEEEEKCVCPILISSLYLVCRRDSLGQLISPDGERNPSIL